MNKSKREILTAIDACRPGSDDLYQEEMSSLAESLQDDPRTRQWYDRSQRLDAAVAEAFRDVPVPAGLADRLLASVSPTGIDEESVVSPAQQRPAATRRRWRRWALSLTAGCASLVLLAVGLAFFFSSEPTLTSQAVVNQAIQWTYTVGRSDDPWNADLAQVPKKYVFDRDSLRRTPSRWQRIQLKTSLDRRAVVYDLTTARSQPTAVLFVVDIGDRETTGLQGGPTFPPSSETDGWCVGTWRKGRRLYVLAVQGDKQRYREMVKISVLG